MIKLLALWFLSTYSLDIVTKSYNSDIDLDSLSGSTWSSYYEPDTDTISGEFSIIPTKAYKAGTVTIEITIEHL